MVDDVNVNMQKVREWGGWGEMMPDEPKAFKVEVRHAIIDALDEGRVDTESIYGFVWNVFV